MKFSIFFIPSCAEGESYQDEYDNLMEQCVLADELGFDAAWVAEHHFSRVGMCPDALMVALAIAQKTKKIRVGTAISIVPFHNPIRLAEQAALVDVLSGGRLDFGIGRGSQPKEFQGFNIDPSESRERMHEGIEIMTRLLAGETLTFHGKYYSCIDTAIYPKPVQDPLPIWISGTSPETYQYAAEKGFYVMASAGHKGAEHYLEKIQLYKDGLLAQGKDPEECEYLLAHNIHVTDDPESAWKEIEPAESWYLNYRSEVNSIEMPIEQKESLKRNMSYKLSIREQIEGGGVIGPPEKVIEDIERLEKDFKINHVMNFLLRGINQRDAIKSLERFATEVIPHFKKKEVKSSAN
tara:strand:- start:37799 stop:38851 length:1053 start_codon:yes stop_codon:yes gene_type:complete